MPAGAAGGPGKSAAVLFQLRHGGIFLAGGLPLGPKGFQKRSPRPQPAIQLAFAVVCFFLGMVPILSARLVLEQYVFVAGTFLVLYGAGKIVHAMYENGKKQ